MRNLKSLFQPNAIAVVGASNRQPSVGHVVTRNLLAGGFNGPIMPVNPRHRSVGGILAYPSVDELPVTPDLAIVCTPPTTVPGILSSLGRRGTRAAIILSGGFESSSVVSDRPDSGLQQDNSEHGSSPMQDAVLAASRPYGLRILGTDSLGLIVPAMGLNASFAHTTALTGKVAFVSQSGALCAAVLDWAQARGIGFSHFVSLGKAIDVDFGDVMDYLAEDVRTRAILLYIEDMSARGKFMSVGRAAARNKPVLVVKANRFQDEPESAIVGRASASLFAPDEIFDSAVRRAGMLRVNDVDELFAAFETLAHGRPIHGDRLLVLSNGGGTGTMASDALLAGGGQLAKLSPDSVTRLDAVAADSRPKRNPLDLRFDASGELYAESLRILRADPAADAVLVTYAPSALVSPEVVARSVIKVVKELGGNVLTSWVGEAAVAQARSMLSAAGVPTYDTPGEAVRAFLHMANYYRNQQMLMEVPPSISEDFTPLVDVARGVIQAALAAGRHTLTEPEAKAVLCAYGLGTVESYMAASPEEAASIAEEMGFPVALRIVTPGLVRSWEVGVVALGLQSAEAVASTAAGMLQRLRELEPEAEYTGFSLRRMLPRQNTRQLIIGVASDRIFGPVILFGEGGPAAHIIRDRAFALPPLNEVLARDLISHTRISRLLDASVDRGAANVDSISTALVRISQLIVDLSEVVEAELNPVFVNEQGLIVVDACIKVARFTGNEATRLAIRPYPKNLEEVAKLSDGRIVLVRPIRPEDEPAHQELAHAMSPEDLRFRFFSHVGEFDHSQMARFTQIDYEREMAFVATVQVAKETPRTLGVVRCVADAENQSAEFAIMARPEMRGTGLARILMEKMIAYCRDRGFAVVRGDVLSDNGPMLGLARKLGFSRRGDPDGEVCEVVLNLR